MQVLVGGAVAIREGIVTACFTVRCAALGPGQFLLWVFGAPSPLYSTCSRCASQDVPRRAILFEDGCGTAPEDRVEHKLRKHRSSDRVGHSGAARSVPALDVRWIKYSEPLAYFLSENLIAPNFTTSPNNPRASPAGAAGGWSYRRLEHHGLGISDFLWVVPTHLGFAFWRVDLVRPLLSSISNRAQPARDIPDPEVA
jgi:hypothetical protein